MLEKQVLKLQDLLIFKFLQEGVYLHTHQRKTTNKSLK